MDRTALLRAGVALVALSAIGVAAAPPPSPADPSPSLGELWQEPTDLAARDLFYGPWGDSNAPDGRAEFTFISPKKVGTNPGMTVSDSSGREWHVKQGREAQPEVVVSRVLSAVGYHQPPVYFLQSFTVVKEGATQAEAGGRFRLTVKGVKHNGSWVWTESPFVGTPPHQGLLVILVLLNSADLKNVNNAVYNVQEGFGDQRRWFVVRDLGTSLGDTNRFDPTPNDALVFARKRFITGVADGHVQFDYRGVHSGLLKTITPADVRWACRLLAGLTDRQWQDAFRAGGYGAQDAALFLQRIHQKIAEGSRIGS